MTIADRLNDAAVSEVARLQVERDRAITALVDVNDRLAALGGLLQLSTDTLDEDQVIHHILAESLELTRSDGAYLTGDGREFAASRPGVTRSASFIPGGRVTVSVPGAPGCTLTMTRTRRPPYSTGDLWTIEAVAAAAGNLVRLSRLHREEVRRATLEREHRLASELAQSALSRTVPTVAGLEVFAYCEQADLTGGDLLVLLPFKDALWFAVGDVVGKGLTAAMTMTRAISALRVAFQTHRCDDPAGAVVTVADALGDYLDEADIFITAVVGTVQAGGPLRLCNAGHSPAARRLTGGGGAAGELTLLPPTSPPIGVLDGPPDTVELPFGPDALLLVGTDGLAEQPDPLGALFGYDRVLAECAGHGRSADAVGTGLLEAVGTYAANLPASDDRTVLVVRGEAA